MANITKRAGKTGVSYYITVSCGYDIYGKKVKECATFRPDPTLTPKKQDKAAEEFAREFEAKIKSGAAMDGRKITLQAFADRWVREYAPQKLQPGTLEKYREELDIKIIPALGHFKMSDIRPGNINSFFVSMTKDGARKDGRPGGYSKGSITKTRHVLSSIMRTAVEWEIIDKNPCDKVKITAEKTADKIKFFTPEQTAAFLAYIEKPYSVNYKGHKRVDDTGKPYHVGDYAAAHRMPLQLVLLLNLAVYTGLRKGELLALQWADIDFKNDLVHVTKAAAIVGGKQVCKAPKSATSYRTVSIPHTLTLRLREYRAEQIQYRFKLGDRWKGNNWAFIQNDGGMMNYSTPYQAFQDALNRYNTDHPKEPLPVIPFHGLRHTSATLLIAAHQDIKTVSRRLGHAQSSTTMNIYAHSLESADKTASNAIDELLAKEA